MTVTKIIYNVLFVLSGSPTDYFFVSLANSDPFIRAETSQYCWKGALGT